MPEKTKTVPRKRIPYSCQTIDDSDIAAVTKCLTSPFLTQGPETAQFEKELAHWVGAKRAVAVSNGTAALHLTCLALGLGLGGLVWTSPISFTASANAARYVGAQVDFVDVDVNTGAIDPALLRQKLAAASVADALPDILIAVHLAGHTLDFNQVARMCADYGVKLIEDAAHALGATYEDDNTLKVGAHPQSAAATFSFHPLKSITTGEGGMITTQSDELADKLALLRSHGITKNPDAMSNKRPDDGDWYYEQHDLGFNYRICEIQATLGRSQLSRLDGFMAARRARANRYYELLAGLPLILPAKTDASSWHLYAVRMDPTQSNLTRKAMFNHLRAREIEAHVHYIPIHTQPYYRELGFAPDDFPVSGEYYGTCLSLPIYPNMTDADQDFVIASIKDAFLNA
jgi:UDP-4-amino-4,6-dideoxy-N-acetyl-beta-L-altrosamine transaminase